MKRPPPMRYLVRTPDGEELVVSTLGQLHDLYQHGFISDSDFVRSERSDRWIRAGAMPALHGVRARRVDPRKMALIVAAGVAVTLGIALLLRI
ncbi:MAG TPA: hypothetical protein VLT61_04925 [Anaeromyxobacteraceae bacterium]|nr:hypothetical protein [Anaeromyxobacteraceae bacterium]